MKTSTGKRFLATLLCLLMFVSLLPVSVFAEEGEPADDSGEQIEDVIEGPVADAEDNPVEEPSNGTVPPVSEDGAGNGGSDGTVNEAGSGNADVSGSDSGNPGASPVSGVSGISGNSVNSTGGTVNGTGDEDGEAIVSDGSGDGNDPGEAEPPHSPENPTVLTFDSFPYSLNIAEGEAWFSLTAPVGTYYNFNFESGSAPAGRVYSSSDMQELAGSADGSFWLENGSTAYLLLQGPVQDTMTLGTQYGFTAEVARGLESSGYTYSEMDSYVDVTVAAGGSVRLSAVLDAEYSYNVTFAWISPNGNLLSSSGTEYDLENVTTAGNYVFRATDGLGRWTEVTFHVIIENDLSLSLSGEGLSYNEEQGAYQCFLLPGGTREITAVVTGDGIRDDITYQWSSGAGRYLTQLDGETSDSLTITFNGDPINYQCVMTDHYGNTYYSAMLLVSYANNFSLRADVDTEAWTVDDENHRAEITLPAENSGVTMKILASGDDLAENPAEYTWMVEALNGEYYELDPSIVTDADTLTLGTVIQSLSCTVYANDAHQNNVSYTFTVRLEGEDQGGGETGTGLTLRPNDGTLVSDGYAVVALPEENSGTTLYALVTSDGGTVSAVWERRTSGEENWTLVEEQPTIYSGAEAQLIIGTVTDPVEYRLTVTDTAKNTASLVFLVTTDNQLEVEPILEDGWGYANPDNPDVTRISRTVVPGEDATLRFRVHARDIGGMSVQCYDENSGTYSGELQADSGPDADGWYLYSYTFTDGRAHGGYITVDTPFSGYVQLFFTLLVENHFAFQGVEDDVWKGGGPGYIEGQENEITFLHTTVASGTENLVLTVKVKGDILDGLTFTHRSYGMNYTEPEEVELTPAGSDANGWTFYSWTFPGSVTAPLAGSLRAEDAYGNRTDVSYSVSVENNLRIEWLGDPEAIENPDNDGRWILVKEALPMGAEPFQLRFKVYSDNWELIDESPDDSCGVQLRVDDDYENEIILTEYETEDDGGRIYSYTLQDDGEGGTITGVHRYEFFVDDGFGNGATLLYSYALENGFKVQARLQDGWSIYHLSAKDQVRGTLPKNAEALTLQIEVNALNREGLRVDVIDSLYEGEDLPPVEVLEPDDPDAETLVYSYTLPGPITAPVYRCFDVTDAFGNTREVSFELIIDNGFSTNPAPYSYNRLTVSANTTKKLTPSVTANDKSKLTVRWEQVNDGQYVSDMNTDYSMLDKTLVKFGRDEKALTFTTPKITKHTVYILTVDDGYGSSSTIVYDISVKNNLTLTPKSGTEVNGYYDFPTHRITIENAGDTTGLRVVASAGNKTGLTIRWFDQGPPEYSIHSGIAWWPEEMAIATYTAADVTHTLSDVQGLTTLFAQATDRYGNTATVKYIVEVENGLSATAADDSGADTGLRERTVEILPREDLSLSVIANAEDPEGITYNWSFYNIRRGNITLTYDEGLSTFTFPYSEENPIRTGDYICTITDKFGNCVSVIFHVTVKNELTVTPQFDRYTLALNEGETARLVTVGAWEDPEAYLTGEENELALLIDTPAEERDGLEWNWGVPNGIGNSSSPNQHVFVTAPVTTVACSYHLIVFDRYDNLRSCVISVERDNGFSLQAVNDTVTVASGKKATLKVVATADNAKNITYQWYNADGPIKGATKTSYTTPAMKQAALFYCIATDCYGARAYASVRVQIQNNLTLKALPAETVLVREGDRITVAVEASAKKGTDSLSFTWYDMNHGGGIITGEEGSGFALEDGGLTADKTAVHYLSLDSVTADTAGYYRCEVTDTFGNTADVMIFIGVDNAFFVVPYDGKLNYDNIFRGQTLPLRVDVSLADSTGYCEGLEARWWLLKTDNATSHWQPIADGTDDGFFAVDGDTLLAKFPETGTYMLRYEGQDRYGTTQQLIFNVTVITVADYTPKAPDLTLSPNPENESSIVLTFDTIPVDCVEYASTVYEIHRKAGKGKYAIVDVVEPEAGAAVIEWADTSVESKTAYSYFIVATDENEGMTSRNGEAATLTTPVLPALMTAAKQLSNGVQVSWKKVSGAGSYLLERSTDFGASWETVNSKKLTKLNYTDTGAVSGQVNIYRVTPLDKKGLELCVPQETPSDDRWIAASYLKAPAFTTAELVQDNLLLTWDEIPGADTYRVEYRLGTKGAWTVLDSGSSDCRADISPDFMESGKTYTYRVIAQSDKHEIGDSEPSGTKSILYYDPPVLTSAEATASGVKLTWTKVKGAASYRILRMREDQDDFVQIATKVKKTTYVDITAGYQMENLYRVQALNSKGIAISEASVSVHEAGIDTAWNNLFLAAPQSLSAAVVTDPGVMQELFGFFDIHNGGILLTWDPVPADCDVSYVIFRKTGTGKYVEAGTRKPGEPTAYFDEADEGGLKNKTKYTYKVQAVATEGGVESKDSVSNSVTFYVAPILNGSPSEDRSQIVFTWTAVSGASKYSFIVQKADGSWVTVATISKKTTYTYLNPEEGDSFFVQALNSKSVPISYISDPYIP